MTIAALSEADYEALARPELETIINGLDAIASDRVDAELESDILTIEFFDGSRYVLNSHRAARQLWLSADRSAWHFDFLPQSRAWVATKTGEELWATLRRLVSDKLGEPVPLRKE